MNQTWRMIIVDDEPRSRGLVRKMLREVDDFQIVGECANGYEAIDAVKRLRPHLMLLDVQMPELDGFAVLERLSEVQMPLIVFVTAYDQYALKAFEFRALDYLLKPFDEHRFQDMLQRVRVSLVQQSVSQQSQQIVSMLESMKNRQPYLERFVIKDKGRMTLIQSVDVDWIEAEEKYVRLHLKKGTYLVRDTLNRIEECLDPKLFARTHRSAIVRINVIKELLADFSGEYKIVLKTGEFIPLGRTYRDRFFELIELKR